MDRKLVVRREALVELSAEEATRIAGGLSGYSCVGVCMTRFEECFTNQWCTTVTQEICQ